MSSKPPIPGKLAVFWDDDPDLAKPALYKTFYANNPYPHMDVFYGPHKHARLFTYEDFLRWSGEEENNGR